MLVLCTLFFISLYSKNRQNPEVPFWEVFTSELTPFSARRFVIISHDMLVRLLCQYCRKTGISKIRNLRPSSQQLVDVANWQTRRQLHYAGRFPLMALRRFHSTSQRQDSGSKLTNHGQNHDDHRHGVEVAELLQRSGG
jgi:hypothetical protein